MKHLPLFHAIEGRPCLIVGGGDVAARRARLLLKAGASVTVLAPHHGPGIHQLGNRNRLKPWVGRFEPPRVVALSSRYDAGRYALIIAATSDRAVNRRVSEWAQEKGTPVNVVDDPALCSVIMPAIIDRDPVTVAISTGGSSPTLARVLRARLEALLPAHLGTLAGSASLLRHQLKRVLPSMAARTRVWGRVLGDLIARPDPVAPDQLQRRLRRELYREAQTENGTVVLVGAGPGDPELLTLAALRAMQSADVLVHDRLVPESILDLARRDAERRCVGKQAGGPSTPQREINRLLVDLARQGKQVCRLKGGDPFIFGRGGEELQALRAAGIQTRVIPGISAANACAAAAGIPLTHRDHAHGLALLTAHAAIPERPIADPLGEGITRVYYMGVKKLKAIERQLIDAGHPPQTPVAIIERGGLPEQRIFSGKLDSLAQLAATHQLVSPALVIVGKVAAFAKQQSFAAVESPLVPDTAQSGARLRLAWCGLR